MVARLPREREGDDVLLPRQEFEFYRSNGYVLVENVGRSA